MKPMSLNLKEMKKVKEDEHSASFAHPKGHTITIAKSKLPAIQRKQIESLPLHLAKGTPDEPIPDPNDKSTWKRDDSGGLQNPNPTSEGLGSKLMSGLESAGDWLKTQGDRIQSGIQEAAQPSAEQIPSQPGGLVANAGSEFPVSAAPPPTPQMFPPQHQGANNQNIPSMPASGNIQAAYDQGQRGIGEQQKVEEQLSAHRAKIQAEDLARREQDTQQLQQNIKSGMDQQKAFMADYQAGHIDPKHFWNSLSTASKVTAGIGLFLGGFGAAFSQDGKNPAFDMLQKQIDRDIDSQKMNLDKKRTLLQANHELLGDTILASNATRMNMNDIYDHKIQLAASQLGTPQARAAADMAHSKFALENAALLQQNANRQLVMQKMQKTGAADALDLANVGLIPKEVADKEQQSIDAQKNAISGVKSLFGKMDKDQTTANLLNPQSYKRVAGYNSELLNTIISASASKRLTPESLRSEIKPLEIKTTDDQETRKAKMQAVINMIQKHADPTPYANKYGVTRNMYTQEHPNEGKTATNTQGQKIVMKNGQWVPLAR